MKTFTPGQADIQREWHVIDAEGAILGRLATAGWSDVRVLAPYVIACTAVLLRYRRVLDVFAVGDEEFQRKCFGKIAEFKQRGHAAANVYSARSGL